MLSLGLEVVREHEVARGLLDEAQTCIELLLLRCARRGLEADEEDVFAGLADAPNDFFGGLKLQTYVILRRQPWGSTPNVCRQPLVDLQHHSR